MFWFCQVFPDFGIPRRSFAIWSFAIIGVAMLILGFLPHGPMWILIPAYQLAPEARGVFLEEAAAATETPAVAKA